MTFIQKVTLFSFSSFFLSSSFADPSISIIDGLPEVTNNDEEGISSFNPVYGPVFLASKYGYNIRYYGNNSDQYDAEYPCIAKGESGKQRVISGEAIENVCPKDHTTALIQWLFPDYLESGNFKANSRQDKNDIVAFLDYKDIGKIMVLIHNWEKTHEDNTFFKGIDGIFENKQIKNVIKHEQETIQNENTKKEKIEQEKIKQEKIEQEKIKQEKIEKEINTKKEMLRKEIEEIGEKIKITEEDLRKEIKEIGKKRQITEQDLRKEIEEMQSKTENKENLIQSRDIKKKNTQWEKCKNDIEFFNSLLINNDLQYNKLNDNQTKYNDLKKIYNKEQQLNLIKELKKYIDSLKVKQLNINTLIDKTPSIDRFKKTLLNAMKEPSKYKDETNNISSYHKDTVKAALFGFAWQKAENKDHIVEMLNEMKGVIDEKKIETYKNNKELFSKIEYETLKKELPKLIKNDHEILKEKKSKLEKKLQKSEKSYNKLFQETKKIDEKLKLKQKKSEIEKIHSKIILYGLGYFYYTGISPLREGLGRIIDKDNKISILTRGTNQVQYFPDCTEAALRSWIFYMIYDEKKNEFDYTKLPQESKIYNFFKEFNTYDLQKTQKARDEWTKITSNLGLEGVYKTTISGERNATTEIISTKESIAKVLAKLFEIEDNLELEEVFKKIIEKVHNKDNAWTVTEDNSENKSTMKFSKNEEAMIDLVIDKNRHSQLDAKNTNLDKDEKIFNEEIVSILTAKEIWNFYSILFFGEILITDSIENQALTFFQKKNKLKIRERINAFSVNDQNDQKESHLDSKEMGNYLLYTYSKKENWLFLADLKSYIIFYDILKKMNIDYWFKKININDFEAIQYASLVDIIFYEFNNLKKSYKIIKMDPIKKGLNENDSKEFYKIIKKKYIEYTKHRIETFEQFLLKLANDKALDNQRKATLAFWSYSSKALKFLGLEYPFDKYTKPIIEKIKDINERVANVSILETMKDDLLKKKEYIHWLINKEVDFSTVNTNGYSKLFTVASFLKEDGPSELSQKLYNLTEGIYEIDEKDKKKKEKYLAQLKSIFNKMSKWDGPLWLRILFKHKEIEEEYNYYFKDKLKINLFILFALDLIDFDKKIKIIKDFQNNNLRNISEVFLQSQEMIDVDPIEFLMYYFKKMDEDLDENDFNFMVKLSTFNLEYRVFINFLKDKKIDIKSDDSLLLSLKLIDKFEWYDYTNLAELLKNRMSEYFTAKINDIFFDKDVKNSKQNAIAYIINAQDELGALKEIIQKEKEENIMNLVKNYKIDEENNDNQTAFCQQTKNKALDKICNGFKTQKDKIEEKITTFINKYEENLKKNEEYQTVIKDNWRLKKTLSEFCRKDKETSKDFHKICGELFGNK